MKLTPQGAIDLLNDDLLKVFRSPLGQHMTNKLQVEAVSQFVQAGLDAMLLRANVDAQVKFSVRHDLKTGTFMAFLKGTF